MQGDVFIFSMENGKPAPAVSVCARAVCARQSVLLFPSLCLISGARVAPAHQVGEQLWSMELLSLVLFSGKEKDRGI